MSETPPTNNPIDLEMEKLEIHSESKPLEFSDLTTDVLKVIIEKSELKERLILRKVSRGLRALVDKQKSACTEIGFDCRVDHILVKFNSINLVYTDFEFDFSKFANEYRYKGAKVIRNEGYRKMALDDLQFVLKDQSVQLCSLNVEYFTDIANGKILHDHLDQFSHQFENLLKSLNRQIHVRCFHVRAESATSVLAILPYLKARTLSQISLNQEGSEWKASDAEIDQIAELDQWKQAKWLGLSYTGEMWPEKHLMHFARFCMFEDRMGAQEVRRWRDLFSKSENFESCQMYTYNGFFPKQIQNYIVDGDPPRNTNSFIFSPNPTYVIEHPIRDDSTKYMEITVRTWADCILFKKLSRQSS